MNLNMNKGKYIYLKIKEIILHFKNKDIAKFNSRKNVLYI